MDDHQIVTEAMRWATGVIRSLPPRLQEASDRDDMLRLLAGESTGRDGDIQAKALGYAIAVGADRRDGAMVRVLRKMADDNAENLAYLALGVRAHAGIDIAPDLGPDVVEAMRFVEAWRSAGVPTAH